MSMEKMIDLIEKISYASVGERYIICTLELKNSDYVVTGECYTPDDVDIEELKDNAFYDALEKLDMLETYRNSFLKPKNETVCPKSPKKPPKLKVNLNYDEDTVMLSELFDKLNKCICKSVS